MNFVAIRIIVLIFCSVAHCVFAFTDGYCEKTGWHTHEDTKTIERNGMTKTVKFISYHTGPHSLPSDKYDPRRERLITIHDRKSKLIFSKHYIWENGRLIRTIDDDIVRNIVQNETPCDFTIIESSGNSISFHLDSKKEPQNIFFDNRYPLEILAFENGHNILFPNSKYSPYQEYNVLDAIVYYWYYFCKDSYETNKQIEPLSDSASFLLNTENESNIFIKNDGNFSFHPLLHKYYTIIIIVIIAICIIVIYKKHNIRRNKK
jgi:hypothetical protein